MQYNVGKLERLALERRRALQQPQYYNNDEVPKTTISIDPSMSNIRAMPISSGIIRPISAVSGSYAASMGNVNEDILHRKNQDHNVYDLQHDDEKNHSRLMREQFSRPPIQATLHKYQEQHKQQSIVIASLKEKIMHLTKQLDESNTNISVLSGKVNASNLAQLGYERQSKQYHVKLEKSNQEVESLKAEKLSALETIKEMNVMKEGMEVAFESATKSLHEEYMAWSVVSSLQAAFQRQKMFTLSELSDDEDTKPLERDSQYNIKSRSVKSFVPLKSSVVDRRVGGATLKRERDESLSQILYDGNFISDANVCPSDQLTIVRVLPPTTNSTSAVVNKKARRTPKTPSKTGAEKVMTGVDSVRIVPFVGKGGLGNGRSHEVHASSYSATATSKYLMSGNYHPTEDNNMHTSVVVTPMKRNCTVVNVVGNTSDHSVTSVRLPSSGMTSLATTPLAKRVYQGVIDMTRSPQTKSPSPTNPVYGPRVDRRFVLSGFSDEMTEKIGNAIRALGKVTANYVPKINSVLLQCGVDGQLPLSCTHVVIPGTPQSFKAFCGLVSSRFIINADYIFNSLKAGEWIDEVASTYLRCYPPPLMHHRFLLDMPRDTPKDILDRMRYTIEFGEGTLVTSAARAGVVRITSGEDLLNFALRSGGD